jgi:hypothetical protein
MSPERMRLPVSGRLPAIACRKSWPCGVKPDERLVQSLWNGITMEGVRSRIGHSESPKPLHAANKAPLLASVCVN